MKITLLIFAAALIATACGSSPEDSSQNAPTAANRQAKSQEQQRVLQRDFDVSLGDFVEAEAKQTYGYDALASESKTRGWFPVACDLERTIFYMDNSADRMLEGRHAELLQKVDLSAEALARRVQPFVGAYAYAVSQVVKSRGGSRPPSRYGCPGGGSLNLLGLLVRTAQYSAKYKVNVEERGFAPGELRSLIIRELKAEIAREKIFEDVLSRNEERIREGKLNMMELMGRVDMEFTDQELGITPQVRRALDDQSVPLG